MFRHSSRLSTRATTMRWRRPFSTDLPAEPIADSNFVQAWRKKIPNVEPPSTPPAFMAQRPATTSSIPSKLTVNFVRPYSSELSGKENFFETRLNLAVHSMNWTRNSFMSPCKVFRSCISQDGAMASNISRRFITTADTPEDASASSLVIPRIKFKRLDKTAKHIMQILDKEAVEEVRAQNEIPDIKPGYIVQLKVEVPENKRRNSIIKGIVIARRNAGLNTTFRLRRLVAGVGVENLFHLYSPNIKEIKVLDKKKVRRAKLYYLRDKMNALKKH